jgi:hypothetical protein
VFTVVTDVAFLHRFDLGSRSWDLQRRATEVEHRRHNLT